MKEKREDSNGEGQGFEPSPDFLKVHIPKFLLHKILPAIITVLIFFLLFRRIEFARVVVLLDQMPLINWFIAFVLTSFLLVITGIRWKIILRAMNFRITLKRSLLIIIGVWPLGALTPSKAGDLFRAVGLRREIKPVMVVGSILAERVVDLFLLALFAFLGGWLFHKTNISILAGLGMLILSVVVILANTKVERFEKYKWYDQIENLSQSMRMLKAKPGLLAQVVVLTLVKWLVVFLEANVFFNGVGSSVSFCFILTVFPVCVFVGLLPITVGGMGTRDSAIVFFFSGVATAPQALAVGFLYSFFGYWLLALVGLFFTKKALDW